MLRRTVLRPVLRAVLLAAALAAAALPGRAASLLSARVSAGLSLQAPAAAFDDLVVRSVFTSLLASASSVLPVADGDLVQTTGTGRPGVAGQSLAALSAAGIGLAELFYGGPDAVLATLAAPALPVRARAGADPAGGALALSAETAVDPLSAPRLLGRGTAVSMVRLELANAGAVPLTLTWNVPVTRTAHLDPAFPGQAAAAPAVSLAVASCPGSSSTCILRGSSSALSVGTATGILDASDTRVFSRSVTVAPGDYGLLRLSVSAPADLDSRAVPLPASGALALAGFALLAGLRRRRR